MGSSVLPVIITGTSRSGTSLLYRLLDSIPSTFNFLDEGYFFEYLYDIGEGNHHSLVALHRTASPDQLVEAAKKRLLFTFLGDGFRQTEGSVVTQIVPVAFDEVKLKHSVAEFQRSRTDWSIGSLWELWLHAFIEAMGYKADEITTAVFKGPDFGKSAVMALKYLDNPRILVTVRDPRYAIDSLKRSRELRQIKEVHVFELLKIIVDYRLLLSIVRELQAVSSAHRVLVVKYEELATDPQPVMKRVSDFIGLEFHEAMTRPTIYGQTWYGQGSYYKFENVSALSVKRGLQVLTSWEVGFIREQLQEFFEYFGYA